MTEMICGFLLMVLCMVGMVSLLQSFCEWLLSPGKENRMIVLVPLRGHCEETEFLLRNAVARVRRMGGKDDKVLLCVDCGMDEETRDLCIRFCTGHPEMLLVRPEEIPVYFRCKSGENDV